MGRGRKRKGAVECPGCGIKVASGVPNNESPSNFLVPKNCVSDLHKKITCLECGKTFLGCLGCFRMSTHRNYGRLKQKCVCGDSALSFSLDSSSGGDFDTADINETFTLQSAPDENVEDAFTEKSDFQELDNEEEIERHFFAESDSDRNKRVLSNTNEYSIGSYRYFYNNSLKKGQGRQLFSLKSRKGLMRRLTEHTISLLLSKVLGRV